MPVPILPWRGSERDIPLNNRRQSRTLTKRRASTVSIVQLKVGVSLVWDLLIMIASLLDRKTLVSFTASSRYFRSIGARLLLQDVNITGQHARSLLAFLLANPWEHPGIIRRIHLHNIGWEWQVPPPTTRWAALLRTLHLPQRWSRDLVKDAGALRRVLTLANNIEDLQIPGDSLLEAQPGLTKAISSLKSLRTLDIRHAGSRIFVLLRTIQAPLVKLRVSFDGWFAWQETVFCYSTRNFCDTLEVMYVGGALGFQGTTVKSVNMRKLHFTTTTVREIKPFVEAYPNLRDMAMIRMAGHEDVTQHEIEEHRTKNKAVFREKGWENLDVLVGDAEEIYMLAISCPIERLTLDVGPPFEVNLRRLDDVLSDIKPSILHVRLVEYYHVDGMISRLFSPFECLTHLTLTVAPLSVWRLLDLVVDELPRLLVRLRGLVEFAFRVTDAYLTQRPAFYNDLSGERFARYLAETTPTLRRVLHNLPWRARVKCPLLAWTVSARTGGRVSLVREPDVSAGYSGWLEEGLYGPM
ncbi:hypothetical protein OF83DRAFT_453167 [Amylostereum chailletii]|nr:hypothetical protein OF83DRAFT_453167 [Amylostereum chailletii]